ncbi:transporter [Methylobacterium haplocladii]|uniref:Transporter n=1 Tax=Methylobacterium haplocladii TaxID=1176176 RepID=A0A512ILD4_9HYPH|nr:transporter [Methylobacterium haplocladii]GEO98533.1 hypothetical protein MHA02_09210 [Methylobacterium haplocladii]GJD82838.1 hypothetical protein HPGCJGGD_0699 [Methylobacterium haplocladii]GLS61024.1 hypothetical protein GCM10007887_37170 [Methylobacterium haplocladii]
MKARFRRTVAALGALVLSFTGTAAHAASAAQPGQTLGLPTGAQLPIGLILLDTSSFGIRDTSPVQSESNINLPGVVWVPGVHIFGGRLHLIYIQPVVAARSAAAGGRYQSGIGVPLVAAQLAWKLSGNFNVSYLLGGYLPIDTQFLINQGSIQQRFAATYNGDGWNVTGNLLYGTYLDATNKQGAFYPDFLNLDVTATKKFGKWEIGPVAFGSTDLPTNRLNYRHQGQVAVGGLVGYNFGDFFIQAYVTRDVIERNYGGYDTRGWLRSVFFLYKQAEPGAPMGGLLARNQP